MLALRYRFLLMRMEFSLRSWCDPSRSMRPRDPAMISKQRTDCRADIGTEARVWDESLLFQVSTHHGSTAVPMGLHLKLQHSFHPHSDEPSSRRSPIMDGRQTAPRDGECMRIGRLCAWMATAAVRLR